VAFATHQIVINVQALSFMNGQGFSIAATPLVGQSLGKRRPDMAHLYTQRTRRVGLITACAIAATLILFGRQIVGCYNGDAEIVRMGAMGLAIIALIQPMQSSQLIITGTLRGAGDTRTPAMIAFLTAMILRPLLGLYMVLGLHWGLVGAWIAFVADQAMRSLLVYIRFRSGKWKLLKI
jgi:Na+-driven multidrug efflux pump